LCGQVSAAGQFTCHLAYGAIIGQVRATKARSFYKISRLRLKPCRCFCLVTEVLSQSRKVMGGSGFYVLRERLRNADAGFVTLRAKRSPNLPEFQGAGEISNWLPNETVEKLFFWLPLGTTHSRHRCTTHRPSMDAC
jgi:hypothetical protein